MPLLYSEEAYSFLLTRRKCPRSLLFRERRQTPSLERGERVSILYKEEAVSFSPQRRESVLFLSSIQRRGRLLLYEEESVSRLYIESMQPLSRCRGEWLPLSMARRECLDSV